LRGPRAHDDQGDREIHLAKLPPLVEGRGVGKRDLKQDDAWSRRLDWTQRLGSDIRLDDLISILFANLLDLTSRQAVRLDDHNLASGLRHSHASILTSSKDC